MQNKKLTIAGIQIYFDDDGVAQFHASGDKPRSTVEQELSQYRDFIDQWLSNSEEPRPRKITKEEHALRVRLKDAAKSLLKLSDRSTVEAVLRESIKTSPHAAGLSAIQIDESITDAISRL
jgi:hypothetical protein